MNSYFLVLTRKNKSREPFLLKIRFCGFPALKQFRSGHMIMLIVCAWLGQTATFIFGSRSYKAQASLQSVHMSNISVARKLNIYI